MCCSCFVCRMDVVIEVSIEIGIVKGLQYVAATEFIRCEGIAVIEQTAGWVTPLRKDAMMSSIFPE